MTTQTQAAWRPLDTLAHRLMLVRHQASLTQRQAAEQTGITFGEWQSMELGRRARALDVKVAKIARALSVDRDWLMWGGALATEGDEEIAVTGRNHGENSGVTAVPARVLVAA